MCHSTGAQTASDLSISWSYLLPQEKLERLLWSQKNHRHKSVAAKTNLLRTKFRDLLSFAQQEYHVTVRIAAQDKISEPGQKNWDGLMSRNLIAQPLALLPSSVR